MSGARRTVKRVDRGMFFRGEHESKQIEILLLTIRMHRLGDDDRAIFDMPTQNHLRRGNPMLRCDALNRTISGVQISTASHRRICFHGNAVRLAIVHDLALLPGRMQLNLVDGRIFAGLLMQAVEMLGQEIAHTSVRTRPSARNSWNAFHVSLERQSNGVGQCSMYMST